MESATLDGSNAFVCELCAAVDQARFGGAVFHGFAWDFVVVGFVGLAEVGGVGIGHGAFLLHPQQGSAGVQAARESDADFFTFWQVLQYGAHGDSELTRLSRSDKYSDKAQ